MPKDDDNVVSFPSGKDTVSQDDGIEGLLKHFLAMHKDGKISGLLICGISPDDGRVSSWALSQDIQPAFVIGALELMRDEFKSVVCTMDEVPTDIPPNMVN